MSKVLIVCYSYTGTSRRVAHLLGAAKSWPVGEVLEIRPRLGASGTWRCVLDSLLRRRPRVRYEGPPLTDYDAVVLVAPIWAGRLAGPMRSFIFWQREYLRDVAIVLTMGSRGADNAVAEVTRLLGHAPVLTAALTTQDVEDGICAARLETFGTAMQTTEDQRVATRLASYATHAA